VGETEGVIKYRLDFKQSEPILQDINELNVWRSILHGLGLVGQQADRYLGYGFGNLSQRSHEHIDQFVISASQTGHLAQLDQSHYSLIENFDIDANRVQASGCLPPSSEALSHAMIYRLNAQICCVLHIHDPVLWNFGLQYDYPASSAEVEYGTVAMAHELERLYQTDALKRCGILIMRGHEDGVIVFADSIAQAGLRLLELWVAAH
jgi:L-ribulose-5-phosphate 4-epimerase